MLCIDSQFCKMSAILLVWVPKAILGVNLALGSIQCFIVDSIAPESLDSKSAGCQAVTLGEIELLTFKENKLKNTNLAVNVISRIILLLFVEDCWLLWMNFYICP